MEADSIDMEDELKITVSIWEMTISIWEMTVSIWDILSLWPRTGEEQHGGEQHRRQRPGDSTCGKEPGKQWLVRSSRRGPRRKPAASSYTLTRLSLSLSQIVEEQGAWIWLCRVLCVVCM